MSSAGHGETAPSNTDWTRIRTSPPRRAGPALERPEHVGADPAAVERAVVRLHPLVVDPARADALGVERDVVGDGGEARDGVGVGPRDVLGAVCAEVDGLALPLAERACHRSGEEVHAHVVGWEVVRRRLARLEDAVAARGVGDRDAAELDPQALRRRLDRRGPGGVPDRLLPRARLDALHAHHGSMDAMDDDARLREYALRLADAIDAALPAWVVRSVERFSPSPEVLAAARVAGDEARVEVGGAVRALLLEDIDD